MESFVKKEEMVAYVDQAIAKLRDEFLMLIKRLEEVVNLKADTEDLVRLEQQILAKLEEIVQALMKQFANKQETKKALIYLEQKVNQLFLFLEGGEREGDGLIVKKPWSCISCDKELERFKGQLGEYRGW